jgi:sortase A
MNTFVYKKGKKRNVRKFARILGVMISFSGVFLALYMFFPLISWEIYLRPAFANQTFASPIPKTNVISPNDITSLVRATSQSISGLDYSNVNNWIPETYQAPRVETPISYYYLSIPKLKIQDAIVSTVDNDIGSHLVQFQGTVTPPSKGTAAIFGHSTLPQLYNPHDYHTIFAYAHTLVVGDEILTNVDNTLYKYRIFNIQIVDPEDTPSFLAQSTDDSYLTIITCTPPGTIWKRLILRARLETM